MIGERFRIDYKLSMPESQKDRKDGTVAEDQRDREYYYDDAHGYEEYEPEEEEDCDDDESGEGEGEKVRR